MKSKIFEIFSNLSVYKQFKILMRFHTIISIILGMILERSLSYRFTPDLFSILDVIKFEIAENFDLILIVGGLWLCSNGFLIWWLFSEKKNIEIPMPFLIILSISIVIFSIGFLLIGIVIGELLKYSKHERFG